MKIKNIIFTISCSVILISCFKEKYNEPSQVIPVAGLTANVTISNLKTAGHSPDLLLIGDTLITSTDTIINPVIQGTVNSTDESGNIYKTLYIQDNTGGIQIAIDKTNLYNTYKIGQKVFVKLSGLYLGYYGGAIQIGYIYGNTPDPVSIGRIPDVFVNAHVFCDSLPGAAPIPLDRSINSLSGNDVSMLVKLHNVHFQDVDSVFSTSIATTDRTVIDSSGATMVLRNSNYANFRNELLPSGQGNLVGVYSEYNGTKQLYIRDLNDLQNWVLDTMKTLINESFTSSLGTFTQYSVLGNEVWVNSSFGSETFAKMSGYVSGNYFANEDWLISKPLNLDNYTYETLSFRTAMKYGTAGDGTLKIYTSSNYSGTGDPNLATWNEITTATLSTGNYTFTSSGNIDLSGVIGTNVYLAFKYSCGTTGVPTWEVTSIKLKAKPN